MGGVLACSFRRLHIAPFTAELEDRIIAPSVKPFAREISFHAKPTFPERAFGFVDLPEMEAEKLKKKLNGSTLRGQKVSVQDARPVRKRKSDDDEDAEDSAKARKAARRDKKKREEGVLPGVELEGGRSVKRGWAEEDKPSKSKGNQSKSRAVEGEVEGKKLRFKTIVPPDFSAPEEGKGKKKQEKDPKSNKNVVVEEFGKSKKVLVTSGDDGDAQHGELSYEDGKGWIDESGNVAEAERPSKRPSRRKAAKESEPTVGAIESTESTDFAHADGMAIDDEVLEGTNQGTNEPTAENDQVEAPKEVHPLEALFKRPTSSSSNSGKSRPKPINTSFSFFDAGAGAGEEDADMEGVVHPKTPNTKRDFEWRSIRSAAPTPDTAAIGRKFSFPFASGDDDEEDESDDDADMDDANQAESGANQGPSEGGGEESKFKKWFYEHRGEFNRGWKKRRREEKKANRQRENRRLSRRVA